VGGDLLGRGAAARAKGGLIEAPEVFRGRWTLALGVRRHSKPLDGPSSERLFGAFVGATQRKV
jgi:hypothetical protein